jgi:TolB-like protein/class 3 adenylate cyclase/Tfp pilus assembly protein PilF
MSTERRLAAIMFTDIVGYTALMAESEEKGLRVRARHREVVRPLVERYHGEWIESPGDQTLSTFPTALDAVDCGLALQARLEGDAELSLHIGVHLGDLVVAEGEITGDGVNIAARLCPLSKGSDLCVSGEVYRSVRNQPGIEATVLGEQKLKNVPEPVAVYSVTGTAAAPSPVAKPARVSKGRGLPRAALAIVALVAIAIGAGWWVYRPAPTLSPIRSIAVLPLENLSADPEQEYFADGMTEALIGDLARIGSLRVISRTSVMQYKRAPKPLREIANELDVDGIIEGTVMREGDRVRITAQLIDARDDSHIWSDRYDRDLRNILALHSDVARAVAEQVRLELGPEEQAVLTASRPVDPQAYDAYLRGLQFLSMPRYSLTGPADLQAAIEQFERAVELDPAFAPGWAELAVARQARITSGVMAYQGEFPKAREAARRALELDENLGRAHLVIGWLQLFDDWDFSGAPRRALERALQLSPSDPFVLNAYAWHLLLAERRREEAFAVSERLLGVAPLDVSYREGRMNLFLVAGEYERGLDEVARVRELDPRYTSGIVAQLYSGMDRHEEAYRTWIQHLDPNRAPAEARAPLERARVLAEQEWARDGPKGSCPLPFLELMARFDAVPPREIATFYTALGEMDEAFTWLERAYRERDPSMVILKSDLRMAPLHSDPRWDDLLRRIGFPEHPADSGVLAQVGWFHAKRGRPAEAIPKLEQAIELSPEDPRLPRWLYYMAMAHFAAERYEQAAGWAKRALEGEASSHTLAFAHLLLASSDAHRGRLDGAQESLDEARRLWPGVAIKWDLWSIFATGDPALRDRYLDGLRSAGLRG